MKITTSALATVLVMRIFIAIAANKPSLQFIFHDQSYHLYYGLAILAIAAIFRHAKYSLIFFGIGAGLVADDISAIKYVLTGPALNPIEEYWSSLFIIPLLFILFILAVSEHILKRMFARQKHKKKNNKMIQF